MEIMLDVSPRGLAERSARFGFEFWQLRTPLTRYALSGQPYGLDNGCFKRFERTAWERLLREAHEHRPVFACLPDLVGDARRTLDLFEVFRLQTNGLPRALVLQDGIGQFAIPWEHLSAVFVGGTDSFKTSAEARNACRTAKMLGKWVHIGRVNTPERARYWRDLADSIDGSGISRDPRGHQLADIVEAIRQPTRQASLPFQKPAKEPSNKRGANDEEACTPTTSHRSGNARPRQDMPGDIGRAPDQDTDRQIMASPSAGTDRGNHCGKR